MSVDSPTVYDFPQHHQLLPPTLEAVAGWESTATVATPIRVKAIQIGVG